MTPQKIISLSVSNFMRVSAVDIELSPTGELVIIAGDNEQGKSSVIQAIEYVLGGKRSNVARPIRDGANKAEVCCTLTDYVVTRTTTASGGTGFKVTTRDKKAVSSPQTLLDGFLGALSFDPLEFHRMATKEPAKAVMTLMKLAGLDFSKLDERRASLYNERTDAGRTLAQSKAKIIGLRHDASAPADEIVTADLVKELALARGKNAENKKQHDEYNAVVKTLGELSARHASATREINRLQSELDAARHLRVEIEQAAKTGSKLLAALKLAVDALADVDEGAITSSISGADAINTKVRANKKLASLNDDIAVDQKTVDDLTVEITSIDKEKETLLSNAKFPVTGISFNDSGVVLDSVPWAQCSTAQRLKATTAIGVALNPGLRAILVREGGNDLDQKSMAIMSQIAKEHDVHIILERCTVGPDSSFVIEDGHIKQD